MQIKSSTSRYGSIAILFHWVSAIIIVALLILGFRATATGDPALKAGILRLHVPLGGLILVLTVLRLFWRMADRKPQDVGGMPAWQAVTARVLHAFIYVTIIVMGVSGVAMIALSGAAPILFEGSSAPLPNFWDYAPRIPHGIGAFVLLALIAVHVAAAMYHQLIKRDRLLARMGFGRPDPLT